jgi:hypothetical protein
MERKIFAQTFANRTHSLYFLNVQKFWTKSNTDGYGQHTNSFLGTLWNKIIAMIWKKSPGPSKLIPRNLWTAFKRLPEEKDLAPHNRRMLLAAKRSGWNVYYGKGSLYTTVSGIYFIG